MDVPVGETMPSSNQDVIVVFDSETTGLSTTKSYIVELAASVTPRSAHMCNRPWEPMNFQILVKPPSGSMTPGAQKVHGLSEKMLERELTAEWALAHFFLWLEKWRRHEEGRVVLVAHNNHAYDMPILLNEAKRNGITVPDWIEFADSLNVFGSPPGFRSMAALTNRYKIDKKKFPHSHRAHADVRLLQAVIDAHELENNGETLDKKLLDTCKQSPIVPLLS